MRDKKRRGTKRNIDISKKRNIERRYKKEKLLSRMKQQQQKAEGGRGIIKPDANVQLWKPGDGFHIIDIIPYEVGEFNVDGEEPGEIHYCFKYFYHRNVGPANEWVLCPLKTYGNPCPICEERQRLIDEDADWEKFVKPLYSKERYLYNIVCYDDRNEENKGVQVWDVSNHYFEKHIMTISKKPSRRGKEEEHIVFFDPDEGKSISFTIEPPAGKDDFAEYVGHAFEDREEPIPDEILESVHCLDEIVTILSYDELEEKFQGHKKNTTSNSSRQSSTTKNDDTVEDLLDELDSIEDNDALQDFIDDYDIDVTIKGGRRFFSRNKVKVIEAIEMEEGGNQGEELDITIDDIEGMTKRELRKLIKDEGLDLNPRDYDDLDDLKDDIIDELGLDTY